MIKKRIGIFGGTFQPIHNGHLLLAEHALKVLSLDKVLFVIDRIPPHKEISGGASTDERVALLNLAVSGNESFVPETMELSREGKSYSFDTLTELHERMPDAELFFLMGSDMLRSFSTWYKPEGISRLATLVCTERAGQNGGEAQAALELKQKYGTNVILLDSVSDLSSTEIRNRVFNALPINGLVPPSVSHEIYYRGLYQPDSIRTMYDILSRSIPDKRMHHTAGVVETAVRLAFENNVDPEKARLAALLHDCAKYLSNDELMKRSTDPFPVLPVLHAEVGAQIAAELYGVTDPEILQAIRLHTTGDSDMTDLDKVIYLADMIEPSRNYPGVEELRKTTCLNDAVLLALKHTLKYLEESGSTVHPATIRALKDLGGLK